MLLAGKAVQLEAVCTDAYSPRKQCNDAFAFGILRHKSYATTGSMLSEHCSAVAQHASSAETYTHACPAAAMPLQATLCRFQSALWQATLQ
jgi:hypothetical protein